MNGEELTRPTGVGTAILGEEEPILPEPSEEFVETAHVQHLTERALAYLDVGYAVHFAGPAGTGKTTLAFHIAAQRARPVILIHGDDEFASSDLVGRDTGYRKQKLVDNFIHSVLKTEETMSTLWVDNRLTTACQQGHTLIYDEFNRSRPEANNALLSVLEEKILNLPKLRRGGESYLQVHPGFRAIFTSNPEEYAGIHKMQDALMDRLVTIHTDHLS
jgi:gas vesicle protein GvpN